MSTTAPVSPTLSDSAPPSDPAALQEWLDERIEEAVALIEPELRRLTADALLQLPGHLTAAADTSRWSAFVERTLGPLFGGIWRSGALAAFVGVKDIPSTVGTVWNTGINQEAMAAVKAATNRLTGLGDDVWKRVQGRVATAITRGEHPREVQAWIREEQGLVRSRAEAIARTEVVGAYNNGDHAGAANLGEYGPTHKSWLATHDARTRPTHVEANGQVRPFNEPFQVGGATMRHPHDYSAPAAETINCRCVALHYWPGDDLPDGTTADEVHEKPLVMPEPVREPRPTKVLSKDEWFDPSIRGRDWKFNPDPEQRAAAVWQQNYAGQRLTRAALANLDEGRDALHGLTLESGGLPEQYAKQMTYSWNTAENAMVPAITDQELLNEVGNSADWIAKRLDEAVPSEDHLWRGMRIESMDGWWEGDVIEPRLGSWTPSQSTARHYTSSDPGVRDGEIAVLVRLNPGAPTADLSPWASGDWTDAAAEHLHKGRLRVTKVRTDPPSGIYGPITRIDVEAIP